MCKIGSPLLSFLLCSLCTPLQPQIKSFYLEEAATSFYWNLIWNKLYSIDLWNRCVPYFEKNAEKIVMCDDIAFTVVLYSEAKKYTNIHDVKYYYLRRSDANSVGGDSVEKTTSIINDIGNVFSFFENYVSQRQLDKHGNVCMWKKRYLRIWTHGIKCSSLRPIEKKILCSNLQKQLNVELDEKCANEDWIFSGKQAKYNDGLEQLRKHIANSRVKYVSFDIFDTLLKRSLWEPFDLFELLNFEYKRLSRSAAFVEFSKCERMVSVKPVNIMLVVDGNGKILHLTRYTRKSEIYTISTSRF